MSLLENAFKTVSKAGRQILARFGLGPKLLNVPSEPPQRNFTFPSKKRKTTWASRLWPK